jgi:NADPH-dependent 2,4-dienoyl-CoA reductase/sulfur reductase-like enzyme
VKHGFDVIILGGGAAGLMCAIEAGKRGKLVAVLERSGRIGKKILISGGGRCNFTNLLLPTGKLHLSQPTLCEIGAGGLHPRRFHSIGGKAWHCVSREDSRAAFL